MSASWTPWGVAFCAVVGVWLVAGVDLRVARGRALAPGGAVRPDRARARWRPDAAAVRVGLCCLAGGGLLSLAAGSPVPWVLSALAVPLVDRGWRRRRAAAAARRRREAVVDFCVALAGEVQAGRPAVAALATAGRAELGPLAAAPLAAARYGGDVPGALRSAAGRPGAEGLSGVAACWEVAVQGGASLAAGLERVATALRAERDQDEELRALLAGPRATARVLAALPLGGLVLGSTMGIAPLRVLFGTPLGLCCLALGVFFQWAGMAWTAALVRSAEGAAR
ncbi:tight adherence protein B [Streptomyces zhaozhouensis]|uniref:Tight adherence protein B n=1 Tax=Streptomyces zhaozhouensis TaxID=1300267 RepID=A0A286DX36_9ACTN|nr:type II secretion system F family protein [Streptomyces zhaozhouensis]SOD63196.1 tight adherence protein B [Streptomyces zhaozhouensis]